MSFSVDSFHVDSYEMTKKVFAVYSGSDGEFNKKLISHMCKKLQKNGGDLIIAISKNGD